MANRKPEIANPPVTFDPNHPLILVSLCTVAADLNLT